MAKILGEDVEFSNAIEGAAGDWAGTGSRAAELLLRQIEGVRATCAVHTPGRSSLPAVDDPPTIPVWYEPAAADGVGDHEAYVWSDDASAWDLPHGIVTDSGSVSARGYDPQDAGRRYLPGNGGCAYEDLGHLELCIPEVRGAREFVAVGLAMRDLAGEALRAAQDELPAGERLVVLANNSDGLGHSYGSHLNVLLSRPGFEQIFGQIYPALLWLGAVQASSIVFTGQGKAGAENGLPHVDYQLAGRADFVETLMGQQTTWYRPLVNSRDEALCGRQQAELARLHCIFFDNALCDVARYLKAGMMQIALAMVEAEAMDTGLLIERPEQAVRIWSRDPSLRATAPLLGGGYITAVQHQQGFLDGAKRFVERGECEGLVPEAAQIVALWEDTLDKLERRDWEALAPRVDWVLKRCLIEQALDNTPGLGWASPEVKHLDLAYASLDDSGLHSVMRRAGLVETLVSDAEIERARNEPPADTRAFARAMLLRRWGGQVESMDWDHVRFAKGSVVMSDPRTCTRGETAALLDQNSLDSVLAALGASTHPPTYHGGN